MIKFILGIFVGAFLGITLMCLVQVAKEDEQ